MGGVHHLVIIGGGPLRREASSWCLLSGDLGPHRSEDVLQPFKGNVDHLCVWHIQEVTERLDTALVHQIPGRREGTRDGVGLRTQVGRVTSVEHC